MPPVCKFMGKQIGTAHCSCDGAQRVHQCTLLNVPCCFEHLKVVEVELLSGQRVEWKGIFCNGCQYRNPPVQAYKSSSKCLP